MAGNNFVTEKKQSKKSYRAGKKLWRRKERVDRVEWSGVE
jgi:hypothetical protein